MATFILLGVGAGLVSALLFSVVAAGAPLGVLLLYLAPLPILIVALGWHHLVGLLGLAVGGLAISLALRPSAGLAFALGPALCAWWLAYLTLLARPLAALGGQDPGARGPAHPDGEWFPTGGLLLWIGLSGAFVAVTSAVAIGNGQFELYRDSIARLVGSVLRFQAGAGRDGPLPNIAGVPGPILVDALVRIAPAGLATVLSLVLALNLWSAAKVVAISGRLARPWPDLPSTRMRRAALFILAGGFVLALLPGFPGVAGVALVGGLTMAFSLQGLAFLHDVSRGRPGRIPLLMLAYCLAVLFSQVFLPLLAVAGMADSATPLRRNLLARRSGPGGPPSRPLT